MITYLKSETERLEKDILKYNDGDALNELSTLIKTSWIFARKEVKRIIKEDDILYQLEGYLYVACDGKLKNKSEELTILNKERSNNFKDFQEIISYCEAKAKEHKIDLEGKRDG